MAYMIIRGIRGNSSKIVTSHVYGYTDLSVYLHSYVEATSGDEERVIDGTLNAMINKDSYKRLRKPDVLTEISFPELESDIKNYLDGSQIELAPYYLNRQAFLENLREHAKK